MIQSVLYSWPVILEGMTHEVQRPASGVLLGEGWTWTAVVEVDRRGDLGGYLGDKICRVEWRREEGSPS